MWNMVKVVLHIYQLGYVHGNISLDNILLESESLEKPKAYLTGFSRVRPKRIDIKEIPNFQEDVYIAKEDRSSGFLTPASDVYALGTVFYFLVQDYESDPDIDDNTKSSLKDLLSGMLQKDPNKRLTILDVHQHPFFSRHLEEIGKSRDEVETLSSIAYLQVALDDGDNYISDDNEFVEEFQ